MTDEIYMRRALELAERGMGRTSPNPMVGAVIVKDGRVIAEGWHHRCGGLHAERDALSGVTEDPSGGTMYVTLEPCCHTGRQPPCTEAILQAGLRRVVIGSADPNPQVCGQGAAILREHGVLVDEDVLREECDRLNEVFLHYIRRKIPFGVLKYAMTLDGKIASRTGASKWITGEEARAHVHTLRNRYRGIMVGVGTVLADDPMLNCRMENGNDPVRIICDTHLRTPLSAGLVQTAGETPTIFVCCAPDKEKRRLLEQAGCRVLDLPAKDGHPDLQELFSILGEEEIDSILIEGGGTLSWSALEAGLVQKTFTYISPMIMGGKAAKSPVGGYGFESPDHALRLKNSRVTRLGEDFLIESEVLPHVHGDR